MQNSIYENLYFAFAFTIAFCVTTNDRVIDSTIIQYLQQRTIVLNEIRSHNSYDGLIKWVEGVLAGVFTLIFKPAIDTFNKKYIQPYINKQVNRVKRWHDSL